MATKQRPLVATSAICSGGRLDLGQEAVDEGQAVAQGRVNSRRRRRRLIENPRVVQESQEEVKQMLARRFAADVAAQEGRRLLQHLVADGLEGGVGELGDRAEQPRAEPERIGILGRRAAVVRESNATDERLGARVLHQVVEVDLDGLGARTFLQQDVAALDEAEAVALDRARLTAHVQCSARRKQRTGEVLGLVSEIGDEVPHDANRSIRTPA